jgi:hypothetical protein
MTRNSKNGPAKSYDKAFAGHNSDVEIRIGKIHLLSQTLLQF